MDEQVKTAKIIEGEGNSIDFSMLVADAPVMLWVTNNEGKTIFSNSLYQLFLRREKIDALGSTLWSEAIYYDDQNRCLAIFSEALQTHKAFVMEYRLQRQNGECRYIVDRGEPYLNRDGTFSGFIGSSTDITEHRQSEDALTKSHQELLQDNHEMSLINQLNTDLQSCQSLNETYPIIVRYGEQLFPDWMGCLYVFNANKTGLVSMASWGDKTDSSMDVIALEECWALRQEKVHSGIDTANRLRCHHTVEHVASYTCTPVLAQGEILGMLYLEYCGDRPFPSAEMRHRYFDSCQKLMKITADNLAMPLMGLQLREALKHQSIRDPLTSLFNRCYMEASLEREIIRCERAGEGVGVVLVEIDHFKQFNDNYSHDAGDTVLVEFAKFMTSYFRQSDIVCRYSEEVFIVIMPSAPQHLVVERATQLCYRLHDLQIDYDHKKLPRITASFGVSYLAAADQQRTANVIKLADAALYAAKQAGRDQVVLYDALFHNIRE